MIECIERIFFIEVKTNIRREWMCFYCKEQNQKTVFPELKEVFDHWQHKHSSEHVTFKFYLIDLIQCQSEKCRYFSNFQGLWNHHKKQHLNETFVAVYNDRCALCLYGGDDLKKHVCEQFRKVELLRLINPIVYTEESLAELQTNVIDKRRFDCKHCGSTFDTREEMMQHHRQNHGYENKNSF